MSAIEIRNLSKTYRVNRKKEGLWAAVRGLLRPEYEVIHAVRSISLTVERGEFVAFLGPNGAGKTTTLKLLSGIITPTAGTATVLGHVPWKRENAYRRRFALVMGQKNQLWWDLPAAESFRLHQQIYQIPPDQFTRTRDELTDMLGVRHLIHRPVRELSLGERMKMELIAALLHSPEVLFLDEPTIGLDVVAQYTIQQFLREYQAQKKTTVILTSHYMKDVAALCRRVVVIFDGRIIYDGSLSSLVDHLGAYKIITIRFANGTPDGDLARFGQVILREPPRIKLRVPRTEATEIVRAILAQYAAEDVSVEDPPLEELIATLFTSAHRTAEESLVPTPLHSVDH
ncbi:MAG: ABC transporter ATP-binding protein [Thermogutta sp.]|uniref:ABC transporter ATP-binding protein n=1 Tax=Thermogutta sp. TaxID=1962930 RepID=UPI0019A73F65|nr:ABC transporter ATP-binding protein [Thermogutta sp.]MBC7353221.1 ABC transporter ATP-binding protein [Thermogutta sp.]